MRLDKILATRGGYSRKEVSKMIRRGRVLVDGERCKEPKTHFEEEVRLEVDGFEIDPSYPLYMYHKPMGMVTTTVDSWGRECVGDILPVHYHIVGRLDKETHGLLLFSRDGQLTQHLLHPKRAIEREYIATVAGEPTEALIEKLAEGIETSVGLAKGKVLSIEGDKVRVVMTEGRNRIVRRMLHNAGHSVIDLYRVRFGPFLLDDLEEGTRKAITNKDLEQLGLRK